MAKVKAKSKYHIQVKTLTIYSGGANVKTLTKLVGRPCIKGINMMKGLHYIKWASNAKDGGTTYKKLHQNLEGATMEKR